MLPRQHLQGPPRGGRRILLIARNSNLRTRLCTFLTAIGCTWTTIASTEELGGVERGIFDAVLIDIANPGVDVEEAILRIRKSHPGLSERILAVSSGATASPMLELAERHDLRQISNEVLLEQLWATLQEILATPRLAKAAPGNMRLAQLIFDSFRAPAPAGIRGTYASARQLVYQHERAAIDLLIELEEGSGRVVVAGQVLDPGTRRDGCAGLSVLLVVGMKALARTVTNRFGEFSLTFEFVEDASIEIRFGEGSWSSIPLGTKDWIRKR